MTRALLVPLAALLAATALALLASGAFAVGNELRTGIEPSDHLAATVAGRLVGARPQRTLSEAVGLLRTRGGTLAAQLERRRTAESLLVRLAGHGSGRAANLLGVLALEEANTDRRHAQDLLAAARAAFVQAIRADPHDEDAKYNLELLLARRQRQAERGKPGTGTQGARKGRSSARRPGSGY
jgi:hypothetical protein